MKSLFEYPLIGLLWGVWCGLLPALYAMATLTGDRSWFRYGWTSSIVLAVAAWINCLLHRRDQYGRFAALIAAGMTLGMLADCYGNCLAHWLPVPSLAVAIVLFALGHVGYIWGMFELAARLQLTEGPRWSKVLCATAGTYCLIGAGLWGILVFPSDHLPSMHVPTAVYTVFLSLAAAVMASVAILARRFLLIGLGGLLFLASDAFLAVGLFQDNWHRLGDLCWITYGIGQMLIVYGAILGSKDHFKRQASPK